MDTSYKIYTFVIVYIILNCSFQGLRADYIFVYSDHYQQGDKVNISISQCSNFPQGMSAQVTSINTRDQCARFYDEENCSGSSIEILPSSPSHHNLHDWGFNDRAKSVGPCRHACHVEVTGNILEEPFPIQVFSRPHFKGAYADILIDGCTLIPTNFVHRTLSVKRNSHCLQLYNNIQCETKGANVRSIELRSGTPHHDDISRWWFPEARAISHCAHKCKNVSSSSPPVNNSTVSPGKDEVILFDRKHFEGNWFKISFENKLCINIAHEREGTAMSVKVGNKTCVILYDRRDCKGRSWEFATSQTDLSEGTFDEVTRSLKSCGELIKPDKTQKAISSPVGGNVRLNASQTKEQTANTDHYSLSPVILATVIVVPLLGVAISVFLVIFIMKKCHPYNNLMSIISEKEIQEFLSGLGMSIENNGGSGVVDEAGGDYSVELLAQNRPYNEAYEIPRSRIKYDNKMPLGMGEFGVVYKGTVTVDQENSDGSRNASSIMVAIKTVRPNTGAHCLRSLLKEVKVMLYVGKHPHIAYMVGCCTENLRKGFFKNINEGEILVLMEYCSRGSLESFLQKNRQYFKNIVKKGRIEAQRAEIPETSQYQNWEDLLSQKSFDYYLLLQWCIEVAQGMEFLALSKVIHSDLAARNVLVADNFQAKISDFGLSRQLYCYSQYVKKHQEPLPWRWLAIESLKSMEFSSKSDVWSYGVLCWEIFTLGEKPYPGLVWSDSFLSNLEEGLRLGKPKYTTTECYNLMIRCWNEDPTLRPTFTEIIEDLRETSLFSNADDKIDYTVVEDLEYEYANTKA